MRWPRDWRALPENWVFRVVALLLAFLLWLYVTRKGPSVP